MNEIMGLIFEVITVTERVAGRVNFASRRKRVLSGKRLVKTIALIAVEVAYLAAIIETINARLGLPKTKLAVPNNDQKLLPQFAESLR